MLLPGGHLEFLRVIWPESPVSSESPESPVLNPAADNKFWTSFVNLDFTPWYHIPPDDVEMKENREIQKYVSTQIPYLNKLYYLSFGEYIFVKILGKKV